MREIVRRTICAPSELTAELLRRGMFQPEEKAELLRSDAERSRESLSRRLRPIQFVALLARGDAQLATRAVLRDVVRGPELHWLDRFLRFQKQNSKRDELIRTVERAMEGRKGNVRRNS